MQPLRVEPIATTRPVDKPRLFLSIYNDANFEIEGALRMATEKANQFVAKLTLEQKSQMVTGGLGECIGNISPIPELGFNGICSMDGPTALNRVDLISIFPAGLTAAASWDRDLIYGRANALATEFREKGVHVLLG